MAESGSQFRDICDVHIANVDFWYLHIQERYNLQIWPTGDP